MKFQRTKPSMPTIELTGLLAILITVKMMLMKVKRSPMRRNAMTLINIPSLTM